MPSAWRKTSGAGGFSLQVRRREYGVKSELTDEETVCEPTSRMDARNWQSGSRRKCSAGNWDWITGMHGFSVRMDRAIIRGRFFPPVSGLPGRGEDDDDRLHAALELHVY